MTPSEAHESAWQRGIEHDEMTIACRDIIEKGWLSLNWNVSSYKEERRPHEIKGIWCEHFFVSEKGPRWFSDILAKWVCEYEGYNKQKEIHNIYGVFEIKPKLYSAGATLRQEAVQRERLRAWVNSVDGHGGYNTTTFVEVIATEGDPLIKTYVDLGRRSLLVWDGAMSLRRANWLRMEKVA